MLVAISGSETVLGDRRMLRIPSSALLTAGFSRDDDASLLFQPTLSNKCKLHFVHVCMLDISFARQGP